jgi:hypothetical protein
LYKVTQDNGLFDFSSYHTVFCDSIQALEWAYQNGLPRSAIVKSSSPSMLWDKSPSIFDIESRWTIEELEKFQSTIQELTEDIFDAVSNISEVERELALLISKSSYQFQKILYKSACLDDSDFTDSRLLIYVDGKTGPAGNIMNPPWGQLLLSNPLLSVVHYTLKDDKWEVLTTRGISYWQRLKVAGYETIIYRLAVKLVKILPNWIFTKELIMPNENELNIEIASSLALRGVKISEIQLDSVFGNNSNIFNISISELHEIVLPIMRKRVEQWVVLPAVDATMSIFSSHLEEQFKQFKQFVIAWEQALANNTKIKRAVLINAPGNIKGQALAYVCRKINVPLMSSQHGITVEISKAHSASHIVFDNSVANIMFSYNSKIKNIEKSTHFNNSKHYVVGMPMRLIRMKYNQPINQSIPPIAYISTNLYHMGLSLSSKTDYRKAQSEQKLILEVLSKLPHNVLYKTYPEDNRRYADIDPVLKDIKEAKNIELFSDKVDMRYLIYRHRIFVTTCATSTLGWPIMSGKPVVFINQKYNNPLLDDVYTSMSKGIFVFNDEDLDFSKKLLDFLSQPIKEIERLWQNKKNAREELIGDYFSAYQDEPGSRAAKIIIREYLS